MQAENEPNFLKKYVMTLFEIMCSLINKSLNTTNQQIHKIDTPCSACASTLNDILLTKRMGCPECYSHYSKDLLPVLIHVHKSCEHFGKSPKNKLISKENQIKILELKLKQAVEHEKYEQAKEIKMELDFLKNQ